MPPFIEMDEKTTFAEQIEQHAGAVVLINLFRVEPEVAQEFLKHWAEDAALMKRQPGFISSQLHKGIGDSRVFLNYAVWESVADLKRAVNNPEFRARTQRLPSGVSASPHLFQKLAVPGICVE
jgi:heme-degrading monooxygenase HmoA